ncbi:MAG: Lon protease family protein [Wenzhouxiangella sp.]
MLKSKALTADQLFRPCSPDRFTFRTTEALDDLDEPLGQDQFMRALTFGTDMSSRGFNLFVMSARGAGSRELVQKYLSRRAQTADVPSDWCYVFNFKSPHCPLAMRLPAGEGARFRADLQMLIDELRGSVTGVFESDEYQGRMQELQDRFNRQQESGIEQIGKEAAKHDIALISNQSGFTLAPMRDGEVIEPEEYDKLPEEARERIEARVADLQKKLQQVVQQTPRLRRELHKQLRKLNEEIMLFALEGPMREIRERWTHLPGAATHLDRIRDDIVEHAGAFRGRRGGGPPDELLDRYRANVLVDNGDLTGAPVIYEDLPNHHHLVGRIEHQVREGALHTDYSMIRSGALHRANGGYLILDARRVLSHPMAWESLKQMLSAGEVRIESLEQAYGLVSTASLQPECIPLSVKVVLVGERHLYYLLAHHDPDFCELFKVEADLEDDLERQDEDLELHARMLATLARQADIRPLDPSGVAAMVEHASRLAGDQRKLTAHDCALRDLMMEADHWAAEERARVIGARHVSQAISERRARSARIYRRSREQVQRGILMVATSGQRVGQVNALTVTKLANHSFGMPARISATARPGRAQFIDIEREAKLAGPIHSKAVMILSRFIAGRYARDSELSLTASLAFEQAYGGIEGDSASVAEACVLLSAIAGVPLKQSLAVTGSINQHGDVQAVGGVNEKIEGFFDVCTEAGSLNGHGVLVPASNAEHLMLDARVRTAVLEGQFAVYTITSVDDALRLLTGVEPGEADEQGHFPDRTFNHQVTERLVEFGRICQRSQQAMMKAAVDGNGSVDGAHEL